MKKNQILTLKDKGDYFVFDKKTIDNKTYSLLVNIYSDDDVLFVVEKEENKNVVLELIEDEDIILNLISLFKEEII